MVRSLRGCVSVVGAVGLFIALLSFSSPAYAADEPECRVVLYTADTRADAEKLAERVSREPGVPLETGTLLTGDIRDASLELEDASFILVSIASPHEASHTGTVTRFGGAITQELDAVRGENGAYVGPISYGDTRTMRLTLASENAACERSVTLMKAGSVLKTPVIMFGGAISVVLLSLVTVCARLRTRTRLMWSVTLTAAVLLAAAAGAASSAVLYASAVFAPDSLTGWLLPPSFALVAFLMAALPRKRSFIPKPELVKEIPDGAVLGRYQLRGILGSGVTGKTFAAFDPFTGMRVACKVLSPARARDPAFVQRFLFEASVMRQLDTPHCVRLLDVLSAPGQCTLVTEYVHGVTLRRLLQHHGQLTGEQALSVLTGALRGLSHLHNKGLVHRDVKPDNIMVRTDSSSTLIDYGLAAPSGVDGMSVEGSPSYMSPEQVTQGVVDARSDIYACGSILTELLTGRRIFAGLDVKATMRAQVGMSVPDLAHTDDVPGPLAEVAQRALAKNPAERFESVDEFLAALTAAAREVYGESWVQRGALGAAVALVMNVGVAGAGSVASSGAGLAPSHTAASPPSPVEAPLASAGAQSSSGTAATGSHIASRAMDVGASVVALGAVVAASLAAVVVPPEPSSPPGPVITEPEARAEFRSAWGAVVDAGEAGSSQLDGVVDASARDALAAGFRDDQVAPAEVQHAVVPYQTEYSAAFLILASLRGESNLLVGMESDGPDDTWRMTTVTFLSGRPDAGAASPRYAIDPDTLPDAVARYLSASVGSDETVRGDGVFADDAALQEEIEAAEDTLEHASGSKHAAEVTYTAEPERSVTLPDHSVVVMFRLSYRARFSNDPQSWKGQECGPFFEPYAEGDTIPPGKYRAMQYEVDIYAVGIVFPLESDNIGKHEATSVQIPALSYLDSRAEARPC